MLTQKEHSGYILLPRSILFRYPWTTKSLSTSKVFLFLALTASHKDYRHPSGIELKAGQVFTSSRNLANELRMSRNTIKDVLYRLQHAQQITLQDAHNGTIITVCNYSDFQSYSTSNTPTNTPTNTAQVGQKTCLSGSKIDPHNKTINNQETNDGISFQKSEVTEEEIPFLKDRFPFRDRQKLKDHLIARQYTEHEASLFLEKFYSEYTGRKEAAV